eukprot:s839_g4.t1
MDWILVDRDAVEPLGMALDSCGKVKRGLTYLWCVEFFLPATRCAHPYGWVRVVHIRVLQRFCKASLMHFCCSPCCKLCCKPWSAGLSWAYLGASLPLRRERSGVTLSNLLRQTRFLRGTQRTPISGLRLPQARCFPLLSMYSTYWCL